MESSKAGAPGVAVSGKSRVFGLLGYPVSHSLSPAMYNRAFAVMNYPAVYVPFPVEPHRVAQAVAGLRALGVYGANVTVPHKQAVMAFLDEVTPHARRIGAVNTIINRDGRLIGDNTDGRGFLRSLREELGFDPKGKKTVILGAGGAARAIGAALLETGVAELTFANRTFGNARRLVDDLTAAPADPRLERAWGDSSGGAPAEQVPTNPEPVVAALALDDPALEGVIRGADLLVHTTTRGMAPASDEPPLIPGRWLSPDTAVCDIVYVPAETGLLREARRRGCPVLPGLGMLLYQGVLALEAWTERPAPVDDMRRALQEALG